jgi:hypothetical protein
MARAMQVPALVRGARVAQHGHDGSMRRTAAAVLCGVLLLMSSCGEQPRESAPGSSPHAHRSAPPASPLRDGERFVTLDMPEPYTPSAPNGGTDEYRCFLVDPGLTETAFLTGNQFLPQNAAIVHHAIFFRISPDEVAEAHRADDADDGEGWTCFGNAGISDDAAWVAHWAPGVGENRLPAGTGYPMPAGSQMVMQVHYNLMGGSGGADRSGIRLRLTAKTGLKALNTMTLPAPVELPCAAAESGPLCDRTAAVQDVARRFGPQAAMTVEGLDRRCGEGAKAGAVQYCDHTVPQAGLVYAVGGHMHLLGRSITVDLNGKQRLLNVGNYNFDEQAVLPLKQPVRVQPGDTLRVTCTHDAKLRSRLPQLREQPPRYVVWGEGTSDEMCLGLVVWSAQD